MRRVLGTAASVSAVFLVLWPIITSSGFEEALKILGFVYVVAAVPIFLLILGLRNRKTWKGKAQLATALLVLVDVLFRGINGKPPVGADEIAGLSLLEMFGIFVLVVVVTVVALMALDWDRRRFRDCPRCLGKVPIAATRCRFCTSDLFPVEAELPEWHWRRHLKGLKEGANSLGLRRLRNPRRSPG
jgi:hypothetical protein